MGSQIYLLAAIKKLSVRIFLWILKLLYSQRSSNCPSGCFDGYSNCFTRSVQTTVRYEFLIDTQIVLLAAFKQLSVRKFLIDTQIPFIAAFKQLSVKEF